MMKDIEGRLVELGAQLRKLRLGKGMNQRQLGRRAGLDGSKIAKIEKGLVNFTILTFLAICEGLGVSPKEVFEEEADLSGARRAE